MDDELSVQIETVRSGESSVLKVLLRGYLRYKQPVDVKALVSDSLEAGTHGVIMNLSQLSMIDSTGLSTLAALQSQLARRKVRFVLVGISSHMQGVFRMSGMKDLFMEFETEQEALDFFQHS